MILRYVVHEEIEQYEADGWEIISRLSYPHSRHAVLMKRKCDVEDTTSNLATAVPRRYLSDDTLSEL